MKKITLICSLFILTSCGKLPDPASTATSGLEGIWQRYGNSFPSTTLDFHEIVFFEGGISSEWIPRTGLYNYDPNSEPDKNYWRYTFDGTKGVNKTGTNLQYEDEMILQSANQLKVGSNVFMRCANVDGKKLNASYTSYGDVTDPTLPTLPYGQKPVITFANDGTFLDEGLFNTAYVLDPQPAPGGGTYEIKDFTIIMKYTDGRTRQCNIHGTFSNDITTTDKIWLERLDLNKM